MPWVAAIGGVASAVVGGISANRAAKKQANAANDAAARQEAAGIESNRLLSNAQFNADGFVSTAAERNKAIQKENFTGLNRLLDQGWMNQVGVAGTSRNEQQQALDKYYAQQQAAQQPWFDAGTRALAELQGGYNSFMASPDYQFRLQQGEQGINRAALAGGRYNSGRSLKDLGEFNSGLASQEYTNRFNRLYQLAQGGQAAGNNLAAYAGAQGANTAQNARDYGSAISNATSTRDTNVANAYNTMNNSIANAELAAGNNRANIAMQGGTAMANALTGNATNVGNTLMQAGNAQAAGIIGVGNAITGGINGYLNNQVQQQQLQALLGNKNTGGSTAWFKS